LKHLSKIISEEVDVNGIFRRFLMEYVERQKEKKKFSDHNRYVLRRLVTQALLDFKG